VELSTVWDSQRFQLIKVKSHRSFESAKDLQDLWFIAGNFCADMAATLVLQRTPHFLRQMADDIATFQKQEGARLDAVFAYLVHLNKERTFACNQKDKDQANHNRNMDQPKKPPERVVGLFDSEAMGHEAFLILRDFSPSNFRHLEVQDVSDDNFQLCLQGANLGKALFTWARLLSWPDNYSEEDKSDWGMSWLELIFNFYIVTGYNLPIRSEGYGAKSVYISYQSPEAILLPKAKRAASRQILTFRNLLQNVQTILSEVFFPDFKESKCKSLQRLGHVCPVAGVPRRPMIPRQDETITAVRQYILSLQSSAALYQVVYIKDVQPSIQLEPIEDPPASIRFNRYTQFMKKLRKTRQ